MDLRHKKDKVKNYRKKPDYDFGLILRKKGGGGGFWKQAYRLLDIKASKICMEKQLNILCLIRNRKGFQRGEMCN